MTTLAASAAPIALRVHADDDVAVALRDLSPGESVLGVEVREPIGRGHKLALRDLRPGQAIIKYGAPIGRATRPIGAGAHVHVDNLVTALVAEEGYRYQPAPPPPAAVASTRTFDGYLRPDGRVGVRNEIWILCTVGCVANTARRIAERANAQFAGRTDGIHAFTHPFGCSQLGEDLDDTRQITAALASHPNAGGVLLIGLGCESNQLAALLAAAPNLDPQRLRAFTAQNEEDEVAAGMRAVEELVRVCENDRRTARPLSDLVLGLKCGGSDGFSGLTANPLVGQMTDRVTDAGGFAILTEVPEIFGAERLLMDRTVTREVFDQTVALVNDFKRYFLDHGQPISENPSPGNIAGGITTLEEKSLGALQKSGRATLSQVLRYGHRVSKPGLSLLEAPGNDAVSSTALTAAGATVILFTTGRGTPLGFPTPTLKIASNSALAARKPGWIDFDAGVLLEGAEPDATADALLDLVIEVASGRRTRAEENGEREIALWKRGITL